MGGGRDVSRIVKDLEAKSPAIISTIEKNKSAHIVTSEFKPLALPTESLSKLKIGNTMEDVESSYDTLARKASQPTAPNVVPEVDMAFSSRGIDPSSRHWKLR